MSADLLLDEVVALLTLILQRSDAVEQLGLPREPEAENSYRRVQALVTKITTRGRIAT